MASPTTAFAPAGYNGVGTKILKTTDGGASFTKLDPANDTLLLLDATAQSAQHAVASSPLRAQFTVDGNSWRHSLEIGGGQSVEKLGSGYAIVEGTAVLTSKDLGLTFATHKFNNVDSKQFPGRYGAYPSETTWYVTAGSWPQAPPPPPGSPERAVEDESELVHAISEIHEIRRNTSTGYLFPYMRTHFDTTNAEDGQYTGAILKTTDGGGNWTVQYQSTGKFYFNGIHCASETKCVAVAEGHNVATPGAYIYVTEDGGENWSLQHSDSGRTNSLMGARMVSETEVFAVGGNMQFPLTAHLYHSTNGGYTWDTTSNKMSGVSPVAIDCFDGSHCMVPATTATQQCTMLGYK
jgi:photosystem II stability/assembly factor-like uncharacterized protein